MVKKQFVTMKFNVVDDSEDDIVYVELIMRKEVFIISNLFISFFGGIDNTAPILLMQLENLNDL